MFYFSIWGRGYFHGVRILWGGIFMVLGAVPRFHSGDSWYRYQTPESCKQNMCSSLTISLTENYFCLFWFGTTPDSIQELLLPNITFFFFLRLLIFCCQIPNSKSYIIPLWVLVYAHFNSFYLDFGFCLWSTPCNASGVAPSCVWETMRFQELNLGPLHSEHLL